LALNATAVPVSGTSTIEIDITTIILQAVITVAVSVGGGTLLGYFMSERSRTKQEKKEIRKVKDLLADDFKRLNKLAIDDIKKTIVEIEEFGKSDKKIDKFVQDRVAFATYIGHARKTYDFSFWNAIQASGSLIKLNSEEIKKINVIYDSIDRINEIEIENHVKFTDTVSKISLEEKDLKKSEAGLKFNIVSYLIGSIGRIESVYLGIHKLNLTWINVSELSESDSEKLKKIIKERNELLREL